MTATLAVRPRHSHRWIYVVLLVAAVVATVALTIAAFAGTQRRAVHRPGRCSTPIRRPARPVRASRVTAGWRAEPVALPCDR